MADGRNVRSVSRRKTPTPQPPAKATAQQLGRASRARSLRSASREVGDLIDIEKPTRRSARQASVATNDDIEYEAQKVRNTKSKPAMELLGDLTVVEEIDTQIALEEGETPGTPTRTEPDATFRSPGAASEMSGTTAITSFSMIEAEFLKPKLILKYLRNLYEASEDFLEHIVPVQATMQDIVLNIQEMYKPGSDYVEEYRACETNLNAQLSHYKGEEHSYIHIRALHRALFGTSDDITASQSGLDLILYLTNLLVLAKQMMHSDRDEKNVWDVLRQLDNTFPAQFMYSLDSDTQLTAAGESALYDDTFGLALELRTQLAILVLQKSADNSSFDPNETMEEIFFRSESSQAVDGGSPIRGWNTAALGGDYSELPQALENQVVTRVDEIRAFFLQDEASLQHGELVNLEQLKSSFPWKATILRLLDWVRLRHGELKTAIDNLGGPMAIARNVKQALEEPQPVTQEVPSVSRESLRKRSTSFGRDRRRSRKSDRNAEVDPLAMNIFKAKERDSGVHLGVAASQHDREDTLVQQPDEEVQDEQPEMEDRPQDEQQTMIGSDVASQQEPEEVSQGFEEVQNEEPRREDQQDEMHVVIESDGPQPEERHDEDQQPQKRPMEEQLIEKAEERVEESVKAPQASGPPQSSAALLRALKAVSKPQKENRPVSIFDRQPTAQRIEFGDGFDSTQPTPGPSNTAKGKQPAAPSPRKRQRPIDISDSDSDGFETEDRGLHAPERRRNAPVAKKQRTAEPIPTSSAAPTSYQPPTRPRPSIEQEESISETSGPSMTEEEFPPSTWRDQRRLAQENRALDITQNRTERKAREPWSDAEEEALAEYMSLYPAKYSRILQYDGQGPRVLRDRTQVNLKDKARNMALIMIRSGAGLRPGFENIIHPGEKHGRALMAAGWKMHPDGSWERGR